MSQKNCHVLYAKYNSARRPEFRVTTEICEDANGLFVRKRAGEDAARAHLENIYQNGMALRDYYSGIGVIASERAEGALRFPYVRGRTLAEQIDARHCPRERFVAQVNEKLDAALAVREPYQVPFEPTEAFEAIFG